jgi:hypothetical protein
MALPPDAVFEAVLEDVSRADTPAERIGSVRQNAPGQPPHRFRIAYDPARIQRSRRYGVRARLLQGDRLLFTTDRFHPVLTQGQGPSVELLLRALGQGGSPQPASPPSALPAGFEGRRPCADCPGIHYRFDPWPDRLFLARPDYLERNATRDEAGRWRLSPDGKRLELESFGGGRPAEPARN